MLGTRNVMLLSSQTEKGMKEQESIYSSVVWSGSATLFDFFQILQVCCYCCYTLHLYNNSILQTKLIFVCQDNFKGTASQTNFHYKNSLNCRNDLKKFVDNKWTKDKSFLTNERKKYSVLLTCGGFYFPSGKVTLPAFIFQSIINS